jgi:hypothetical protein
MPSGIYSDYLDILEAYIYLYTFNYEDTIYRYLTLYFAYVLTNLFYNLDRVLY